MDNMSCMGLDYNNSKYYDEEDDFFDKYEEKSPTDKIENTEELLKIIQDMMGISDDDMKSRDIVKSKIRDFNINNILK